MKRELVCISCPLGCRLTVEMDENGKNVLSIAGNTCPRGEKYARTECTAPVRMVTASVPMGKSAAPLPVRTSVPIPKELIFDCLEAICQARPELPVKTGQVIISNVLGTGADIIATRDMACPCRA
jgi:CxxC motif-containing protein